MVEAAVEEIPRLMEAIRQAASSGDAAKLRLNAHTLKGSLRYFGARRAFERACELEVMGREGRLDRAGTVLAALEEAIPSISAALLRYIQGPAE
jgi:HPt (histidine-containing phosphotransfer) domain-containing protein